MRRAAATLIGCGLALTVAAVFPVARAVADDCPNAQFRVGASADLPDCRAYELVSPPQKNGSGVVSDSRRTRAAADGNALQFLSLGAFGDAVGTGVATEYIAERTGTPGTSGWTTHAITPLQSSTTDDAFNAGIEAAYVGEFSPDLSAGVFFAPSPLTDDPSTASQTNLYVRNDLLTPGAGTYQLVSHCPLCDAPGGTPLPPPATPPAAQAMRPLLAWTSPDMNHVAFESQVKLTADTPSSPGRVELYEWDQGTVTLAGRVPKAGGSFCDDVNGPACVGSPLSIAGQGVTEGEGEQTRTPDVVSDGSDGHTRVFFTFPTQNGPTPDPGGFSGQLYMRVDGTSTVQLNVPEPGVGSTFAPATFLDASVDGERAFFMTTQALTPGAPVNGDAKIYMFDATAPAGQHLTLVNANGAPADGASNSGQGIVGLSNDGHYVYFVTTGQIVAGQPLLDGTARALYLWHDGEVRFIAAFANVDLTELLSSGPNWTFNIRQARVTPDGQWLLYRAGGQLYLYSADDSTPTVPDTTCVSCPASGPPTADSTDAARTGVGGTDAGWHENHALSDDGSRVFFSTSQQLVPQAVNKKVNVYEYDVPSGAVHLISSGTSPDDSWFLDASANGSDAFFTTSQQLVGWDNDQEYDVYDARVDGGFPDPPSAIPCDPNAFCQGTSSPPPAGQPAASAMFTGPGNVVTKPNPRTTPVCRRGLVRKRVRGRLSCVKKATRRVKKHPPRAHTHNRRWAR